MTPQEWDEIETRQADELRRKRWEAEQPKPPPKKEREITPKKGGRGVDIFLLFFPLFIALLSLLNMWRVMH